MTQLITNLQGSPHQDIAFITSYHSNQADQVKYRILDNVKLIKKIQQLVIYLNIFSNIPFFFYIYLSLLYKTQNFTIWFIGRLTCTQISIIILRYQNLQIKFYQVKGQVTCYKVTKGQQNQKNPWIIKMLLFTWSAEGRS